MRTLIILMSPWMLTSCFDSDSHRTESIVVNNTSHRIVIEYHMSSAFSFSFEPDTISPWEIKALLQDAGSGRGRGVIFATTYSTFCDSLSVLFDDDRRSVHLDERIPSVEGIPFNSPRSLLNQVNWVEKVTKNSRRRYNSNYTYTFTEQDYLDAQ